MSNNLIMAFDEVNAAIQKLQKARTHFDKLLSADDTQIVGYVVRYQETFSDAFGGNQWHGNESNIAIFLVSNETPRVEALRLASDFAAEVAKRLGVDVEVFSNDKVEALHGVFTAIHETKGSEPQFISWSVFPLTKIEFKEKPIES